MSARFLLPILLLTLVGCTSPIDFFGLLAGDSPADPWNQSLRAAYGQPTTEGDLMTPVALARDDAGNLYFSEEQSNSIRKLAPNGDITEVLSGNVSMPSTTFCPGSVRQLVSDGADRLFATVTGDNNFRWEDRIYVIDLTDASVTEFGNASRHMALDRSNNLLYAGSEQNGSIVRVYNSTTLALTTTLNLSLSGETLQTWYQVALAADSNGDLYAAFFSDITYFGLAKVNTTTGALTHIAGAQGGNLVNDGVTPLGVQIEAVIDLAIDTTTTPHKLVYLESGYKFWNHHRVREMDLPAGNISTLTGKNTDNAVQYLTAWGFDTGGDDRTAAGALLSGPRSLVATDDKVWLTDSNNNRIRLVDRTANTIETLAGSGGTSGYSGDGGAASLAQFVNPDNLVYDHLGNLYFTDQQHSVIRRIDTDGNVSLVAGGGPTPWNYNVTAGLDLKGVAFEDSVQALATQGDHLLALLAGRLLEMDADGLLVSGGTFQAESENPDGGARTEDYRYIASDDDNGFVYLATRDIVYRYLGTGADLSNPKVWLGLFRRTDTMWNDARANTGGGVPNQSPVSMIFGMTVGPNGALFVSDAGTLRMVSGDGAKVTVVVKRSDRWSLPVGSTALSGVWGALSWDATNSALYYVNPFGVGAVTLKTDGSADLNTWVTGPETPFFPKDYANLDPSDFDWIPDERSLQVAVNPATGGIAVASPRFASLHNQIWLLGD